MYKLVFGFAALILIGLAYSCNKDDEITSTQPGSFAMTFEISNGDEGIALNNKFICSTGYPVSIENIRFYLSNIRLIKGSGETVYLSQIAFFDLKDHIGMANFRIPAGRYDSIAFDLGVPPELNSPDNPDFLVSAYDNNHPLSESNGMFWGWEAGYRFFTIDGHCDTVPNTSEILPLSLSFHSGRDTLYRKVPAFYHPFTVQPNQTSVNAFALDIGKFFHNDDQVIDLKYERQYHGSLALMPLGIKVANNSAACFRPID